MSGGGACQCGNREAWRVHARNCNYSAFNGYHRTPSAYSSVECIRAYGGCGAWWRTKAAYVDKVPSV